MAGLRFTDLQSRPMAFLDFTSLTLDELQQLVPPFEAAFQVHMMSLVASFADRPNLLKYKEKMCN